MVGIVLAIVNEAFEVQSIAFLKDYEIGRKLSVHAPVVIMAADWGRDFIPIRKYCRSPSSPSAKYRSPSILSTISWSMRAENFILS